MITNNQIKSLIVSIYDEKLLFCCLEELHVWIKSRRPPFTDPCFELMKVVVRKKKSVKLYLYLNFLMT